MRTPNWFYQRELSAGVALGLAPLQFAAWCYGAGAALHRQAYRRGVRRRCRLECCVVSVGSPMVGGTAKTPLAARIASILLAGGYRVALASRGYGASTGSGVEVVYDGKNTPRRDGSLADEPLVLAAQAPGVPVLVARDRGLAGLRAISDFKIDVLVLDDGFAHHALDRDLEIVTLDGEMGFGNGFLLPRGPLREGLRSLERAHAIGVVDGPLSAADEARVCDRAPHSFRFAAGRGARSLRSLGDDSVEAPDWLAGREVGLLSGIAYPSGFERTLSQLGARVVAHRQFPDHHRYRASDLATLGQGPSLWITTEKDAVKLAAQWTAGLDLRVLELELELDAGFSDWLLESMHRSFRDRADGPD